ncbi:MAG: PQQ-binding-like beta-propeller repeat protein [Vicinamibacterales bacterium]
MLTRRTLLAGLTAGAVARAVPAGAQARVLRAPKPLAPDARTHDWASFLGPTHDARSTETRLSRALPPPLVWDLPKGDSYASPAVAGSRLVHLHRMGDQEIVECVHAETGARHWQFPYGTAYEDRYGYNNGPRSSPVIHGGRVFTVGAEGTLHCLDLMTGRMVWKRDLRVDYRLKQEFFGTGATPLVDDGRLIVVVGAPGATVVAFDTDTGREIWRAGKDWGAGYASPTPAVIHGRRRVLVFAGGESQPPSGGLVCLDPATGKVDFTFPWRSRTYESVNASCPVVIDNRVFISATYRTGSALIEVRRDFTHAVAWTARDIGLHFNTAVHQDGYLYAFDGRNEPDASLVCIDVRSGDVVWREVLEWEESIGGRTTAMGPYRGSLLAVDGQFLCLGEMGHLLWLDLSPKGVRQIGRTWLFAARESWTLPVLSRGLLYVCQNTRDVLNRAEPRLACYDLRA